MTNQIKPSWTCMRLHLPGVAAPQKCSWKKSNLVAWPLRLDPPSASILLLARLYSLQRQQCTSKLWLKCDVTHSVAETLHVCNLKSSSIAAMWDMQTHWHTESQQSTTSKLCVLNWLVNCTVHILGGHATSGIEDIGCKSSYQRYLAIIPWCPLWWWWAQVGHML